jgi:hypothetical protein
MSRTLLLAWAGPTPGEQDAFHRWYDEVHIPEVSALLSVVGEVRRFRLALADGAERCLAVYDLGEADPQAAAVALGAATGSGELTMTKAMDITDNPPQIQFVTSLS